MSTIISNNTNIERIDESQSLISPSTVSLSYNVYNTINDPTTGISRIVTAQLTDTVPPYQADTRGQGALGLVISQVPIDATNVTNYTPASFTTEQFAISSTPEAVNAGGLFYSSASGSINKFGNDGPVYGGFGSRMDLNASEVSSGNNINVAQLSVQCMASGQNPYTSIEFDGATDNDSILQLKLRNTYDAFNNRRDARSTLKLPLQYGTAPNTLVTGNYGTSGQVLTSGGQYGNLTWETPATDPNVVPLSTPPDSATLAVNNSVKIQNGETGSESNYIELSSDSGNNTISLTGTFGTAGQVLSSGGSTGSLSWITPTAPDPNVVPLSTPPNALTLAVNNSVRIQNGETGSISNYVTIHADASNRNRLELSGDFGTTGQVLTSGSSAGSLSWTTQGLNTVLGASSLATDKNIQMNNTSNTNQTIINQNNMEITSITGSGGTLPDINLFDQNVVAVPNFKPFDTLLRPDYLQFESMTASGVNVNNTKYGAKTITINSGSGITGQMLGSNGSNTMAWKGSHFQNVQSTSGNVTSTADPTIHSDTFIFISPDAGTAAGRLFTLPVSPPIGFWVVFKNCSGVTWNVVTSETNGLIYGSNTGTTLGITANNNAKPFLQYAGIINVASVNRPVWIA